MVDHDPKDVAQLTFDRLTSRQVKVLREGGFESLMEEIDAYQLVWECFTEVTGVADIELVGAETINSVVEELERL